MPAYKFLTIWKISAPIEAVYQAIHDTQDWSSWWSNIETVEVLKSANGASTGQVERFTFRTELPYKLRFDLRVTRNEFPTLLEGEASGELEGIGRWTLTREGDGTVVNYLWDVQTTRWWMNLLAPLARPLFARNHEAVMKNGGIALAKHLNARLTHQEYLELDANSAPPKVTSTVNGAAR